MNDDNLIPMSQRTPQERRTISAKGGKASAAARRKRADLKRALEIILTAEVRDPQAKAILEDLGISTDNQTLLALSLFQQAVKGDIKAAELIVKIVAEKDDLDKEEQRERIRFLKHQNKIAQTETEKADQKIIIIDDQLNTLPKIDDLED